MEKPRSDTARAWWVCVCGHGPDMHALPKGEGEPWGACEKFGCRCREFWKLEDNE